MNPLIADVLEAKARQVAEIASLEQTFEHEAKCESRAHLTECTETVTHRSRNCVRTTNVCEDATNYVLDGVMSPDVCLDCNKPCSECWTIRPI